MCVEYMCVQDVVSASPGLTSVFTKVSRLLVDGVFYREQAKFDGAT